MRWLGVALTLSVELIRACIRNRRDISMMNMIFPHLWEWVTSILIKSACTAACKHVFVFKSLSDLVEQWKYFCNGFKFAVLVSVLWELSKRIKIKTRGTVEFFGIGTAKFIWSDIWYLPHNSAIGIRFLLPSLQNCVFRPKLQCS